MPQVPLIATKGFTYNTRRLMAGDEFEARNPLDARILTRVRKVAEAPAPRPSRIGYERQGSGHDAGAVGYELVGRDAKPKPSTPSPKAGTKARKRKAKAKK